VCDGLTNPKLVNWEGLRVLALSKRDFLIALVYTLRVFEIGLCAAGCGFLSIGLVVFAVVELRTVRSDVAKDTTLVAGCLELPRVVFTFFFCFDAVLPRKSNCRSVRCDDLGLIVFCIH
jgi:hypothetical protein